MSYSTISFRRGKNRRCFIETELNDVFARNGIFYQSLTTGYNKAVALTGQKRGQVKTFHDHDLIWPCEIGREVRY